MQQRQRPIALVVESDETQRSLLGVLLEESDMHVIACESGEAALAVLDTDAFNLSMVVTDIELAGAMDGVELAHNVHERFPDLRVIVTSAAPRIRRLPDGTTHMTKPWIPLDVLREAQYALH